MQIEEAEWMDDPALCLRACSRLRMSDWEYSHSAEVWSSVCRHNGAQNTFWRMPWLNSLWYVLWCPSFWVQNGFSHAFQAWLRCDSCADEEASRRHIEHVIHYTYVQSTAGKWHGLYQTGLVLNGNVRASLCLLSLIPICLKKEEHCLV